MCHDDAVYKFTFYLPTYLLTYLPPKSYGLFHGPCATFRQQFTYPKSHLSEKYRHRVRVRARVRVKVRVGARVRVRFRVRFSVKFRNLHNNISDK